MRANWTSSFVSSGARPGLTVSDANDGSAEYHDWALKKCLVAGSVHFLYVGIELWAFGTMVIWMHHRWWKTKEDNRRQA